LPGFCLPERVLRLPAHTLPALPLHRLVLPVRLPAVRVLPAAPLPRICLNAHLPAAVLGSYAVAVPLIPPHAPLQFCPTDCLDCVGFLPGSAVPRPPNADLVRRAPWLPLPRFARTTDTATRAHPPPPPPPPAQPGTLCRAVACRSYLRIPPACIYMPPCLPDLPTCSCRYLGSMPDVSCTATCPGSAAPSAPYLRVRSYLPGFRSARFYCRAMRLRCYLPACRGFRAVWFCIPPLRYAVLPCYRCCRLAILVPGLCGLGSIPATCNVLLPLPTARYRRATRSPAVATTPSYRFCLLRRALPAPVDNRCCRTRTRCRLPYGSGYATRLTAHCHVPFLWVLGSALPPALPHAAYVATTGLRWFTRTTHAGQVLLPAPSYLTFAHAPHACPDTLPWFGWFVHHAPGLCFAACLPGCGFYHLLPVPPIHLDHHLAALPDTAVLRARTYLPFRPCLPCR